MKNKKSGVLALLALSGIKFTLYGDQSVCVCQRERECRVQRRERDIR